MPTLTPEQRIALSIYLDALAFAHALSPENSEVEEVLCDAITSVARRLDVTSEGTGAVALAVDRASRMVPVGTIEEALNPENDR